MPIDPAKMFHPERVIDLKGSSKSGVLEELVDVLAHSPQVTDREDLMAKILEREKTLSTGVGMGLALPHVKIASVRDFVIGVGRSPQGVEFDSIDGKPVHLIVMIGCNEGQSTDYMKVLSKLVRYLKEPEHQDKVMTAESPEAVVDLFVGPGGAFSN
jgi:mannitol/fructose-specific phosphotransferase system IIA component (Ntr-type)